MEVLSCTKSVYAQWAHIIDTASECFFVRRHIGEGFLVETAPPVGAQMGKPLCRSQRCKYHHSYNVQLLFI